LCISDQSGAETCITKGQLDTLLVAPSSGPHNGDNSGLQISQPIVTFSDESSSTPPTITIIDASAVATDTIDYVATDDVSNAATSTSIEATTLATSTAQ
jgi:hypothetical protein